MKILLNGICGHMGREVVKLCDDGYRGITISAGVDPGADGSDARIYTSFDNVPEDTAVDCIVDFSHHSCVGDILTYARPRAIPVVIATTGHTEDEVAEIHRAAEDIPVFFSANMSLGVALLVELAKSAAVAMPDAEIEIIEKHHDRKLDAPSGTARMLVSELVSVRPGAYGVLGRAGQGKRTKDEIGVHAIRMGNVVGDHEVILATANQTITIKHEAHSRALFAEGALAAAAFVAHMDSGLYDMKSLIEDSKKDIATSAV